MPQGVLLVVMPCAASDRPAVGVSTLKAGLAADGVPCDVAYLNLAFAEALGQVEYDRLVDGLPVGALAGEWVFAEALYGPGRVPAGDYVEEILVGRCGLPADDVDLVRRARDLVPAFLRRALGAIRWSDYALVGFSSFAAQNLASLALARLVKEAHPGVKVAFGGANWRGRPGLELHRRFPQADFAVSGEGDRSLPALARLLAGDGRVREDRIGGLIHRRAGRSVANPEGPPVEDLDELPVPDYADFYEARRRHPGVRARLPVLMMEGSRGCWWATSHPCTFCGGGARDRAYRSKSAARVVAELRELTARWTCSVVQLTDELVSPAFLDEALPRLASPRLPARLFFEVRPTVTRAQLAAAAAARAEIQVGVESLNDRVLRLMCKGTTALENVRLLRWCRELGVRAHWNLLYALPGETAVDCEELLGMLPAIRFLAPPDAGQPVRAERGNALQQRPADHGLGEPRPPDAYRHLYPFPDDVLLGIAAWVEFGRGAVDTGAEVYGRLEAEVDQWRREHAAGELRVVGREAGRLVLADTRPGAAPRTVTLDALETRLYEACDGIAGLGELTAADPDAGSGDVTACLDALVERRLMVRSGSRYLSLALPPRSSATGLSPR